MLEVNDWVMSELPPPPARVLEVGCGDGALTRTLADAGYDALGIDPKAPPGPHLRAVALEDFDGGPFDAVVAVLSLHHLHHLDRAFDRIAELAPLLVVDEFGWDRMDPPTAVWYDRQRLAGGGLHGPPAREWRSRHAGLHTAEDLRRALAPRFDEQSFSWIPFLYGELGRPDLKAEEQELIAAGEICAMGFRYVGRRR
ncbi:MAG TPA: methyltransferase domain-containing protein [Gaiellaceae bacterium]|jgi:SAM-dependent methyltransferase|nr:methyltransferase domain-containing protein [Gaiellaceae bacterium]